MVSSEQYQNWQAGKGFVANRDVEKRVLTKLRESNVEGLGWDDVATNDKGAIDWWLTESAVPGPFGQPVSEWQNGSPTEWGNPMKYTNAAGGGWSVAENTAVYGGLIVSTAVTLPLTVAQYAGYINTAPGASNLVRITSSIGRWGYRIDKPDMHKPNVHDHFWKW